MRVDDRADGVVQPKQFAIYLNRRTVLRRADFLFDQFHRFQVFVRVHQHRASLLVIYCSREKQEKQMCNVYCLSNQASEIPEA